MAGAPAPQAAMRPERAVAAAKAAGEAAREAALREPRGLRPVARPARRDREARVVAAAVAAAGRGRARCVLPTPRGPVTHARPWERSANTVKSNAAAKRTTSGLAKRRTVPPRCR